MFDSVIDRLKQLETAAREGTGVSEEALAAVRADVEALKATHEPAAAE